MMSEQLLTTLKKRLKSKGVSYQQAGDALELSASSVKRLFAERSFTLPRLEVLCELADTDLYQLLEMTQSAEERVDLLSIDQERELTKNPALLLVGVSVINHCTFEDILTKYQFTKAKLIQLFSQLDQLNIIEYLPNNRYRLTLSRQFNWHKNGPIQQLLITTFLQEYLSQENSSDDLHYVWGMLTPDSAKELARKVQRLVADYIVIAERDAKRPFNEKLTSSLLVSFREDWEPSMFKVMQRK